MTSMPWRMLAHSRSIASTLVIVALMVLAMPAVPPEKATADTWRGFERIAGTDRYDTSVRISQHYFPDGSETVLVATGQQWTDALCASALAGAYDAPLLLVPSGSLPDAVRQEIVRLSARTVILLGGTTAVNNAVRDAIAAIPGVNVERIAGVNRYETARAIAARFKQVAGDRASGEVFIATGANFADALGASAAAAGTLTPILLTNRDALPVATANALRELAPHTALLLGGDAAISEDLDFYFSVLEMVPTVLRLGGDDRYQTCSEVVGYARRNWTIPVSSIGLSSGTKYPDALAAAPALGRVDQMQLLSRRSALPHNTQGALYVLAQEEGTSRVTVFGGTSALEDRVITQARMALDPGWYPPAGPPASLHMFVPPENPARYSTVNVWVSCTDLIGVPVEGATVTFTWRHDTSTPVQTAVTDSTGYASVSRDIGDATPGLAVRVEARVVKDGATLTNAVSFTPEDSDRRPYLFSGTGPSDGSDGQLTPAFYVERGAVELTVVQSGSAIGVVVEDIAGELIVWSYTLESGGRLTWYAPSSGYYTVRVFSVADWGVQVN